MKTKEELAEEYAKNPPRPVTQTDRCKFIGFQAREGFLAGFEAGVEARGELVKELEIEASKALDVFQNFENERDHLWEVQAQLVKALKVAKEFMDAASILPSEVAALETVRAALALVDTSAKVK